MEIINAILKKYINFSLLEIFFFSLFGLGFYYIVQMSSFLPFLNSASQQKDINSFPANAFFLLSWFLLFLIIKRGIEFIYKFFSSFRKYNFKSDDWPKKWEYQGNIRLCESEEDSLYITDSNSGCILKYHYWKNLEIKFQCKFPEGEDNQILGIIFRAKNLSDFLMVQINNKDKKITPHIRMEGVWETIDGPNINTELERNVFFDVVLKVLNERVELFINNNRELNWFVATNSDIVLTKKDDTENTIVPNIDFRKIYGRIGFRAYYNEGAIVKNLSVKRIAGIF